MLKISKLHHHFGSEVALSNINFEITKPGLYVFAGANGSGKSTLFNCINGLLIPDTGHINRSQIAGDREVNQQGDRPFCTFINGCR